VGGATGARQRRRLLEIDVRRLREQRAGLDVGLGAVCTGEAIPDDLVAHREPFDAWTDRLDHHGCLVARNGRELPSTAGLEIKPEGAVDANQQPVDQNLAIKAGSGLATDGAGDA